MSKDYKLKSGNILRVIQDNDAESPDMWSNKDVFLLYDHKQFSVKREGFEPCDIFEYLEGKYRIEHEEERDDRFDDYYIFPVDAYIHSGVHLSLANTANYPDRRWDVSTTGYVLANKEIAKDVELDITIKSKYPEDEDKGRYLAEGLLETWNQYLSGEVYGFQVLKAVKTYTITEEELNYVCNRKLEIKLSELPNISKENIEYEELNSCWGFYTSNPKENGMLDHINDEIIEENEELKEENTQ